MKASGNTEWNGIELQIECQHEKATNDTPALHEYEIVEATVLDKKALVVFLLEDQFNNDPKALIDYLGETFTHQG